MLPDEVALSVSDFVSYLNQTLEIAYPSVLITGELTNFRVSKNRWVYFDLKDDFASVRFFGTVYSLPGPLEDGLMVQVRGTPKLHPLYGFSITFQTIQPVGEGSLKKAAALLEAKLAAEGLFDPSRKRILPYPPQRIGLITSGESAAYHDFMKVLKGRWGNVQIRFADVQVQGEAAPRQIANAIEYMNQHEAVEVLIITRGGGSAEDLAAFSTEIVTRAVAVSRIPTMVAIGHEIDVSLAELAADVRASTPSNAAEQLVPDRRHAIEQLAQQLEMLDSMWQQKLDAVRQLLVDQRDILETGLRNRFDVFRQYLQNVKQLVTLLDPQAALRRGYAIIKVKGKVITSADQVTLGDSADIILQKHLLRATIESIEAN
jgi:exodeoxyribonuclease VII large subunit